MPTIRHKRLAKNLRNSKSMKEAMLKADYSPSYANSSTQMKETEGFKEAVEPVLDRYLKEEKRLLDAAEKKDLTQEQYRTVIDSLDKVRKQIQLLSGGSTGNIGMIIQISQEIANKNGINSMSGENSQ